MNIYDVNTRKTGSIKWIAIIVVLIMGVIIYTKRDVTSALINDAIYSGDARKDVQFFYDGVKSNFTLSIPAIGEESEKIYEMRYVGISNYNNVTFYMDVEGCYLISVPKYVRLVPNSTEYIDVTLKNESNKNVGKIVELNIRVLEK